MENASKALIMAGGILIGVLILSLAAYLFVDFGTTSAEIHKQNEEKQLTEFNSKFTAYEGYKDKGGDWQITIYDIITLAGYAKENNNYNEGVDEEQIQVKIEGKGNIEGYTDQNIKQLITDNTQGGNIQKFQWKETTYNARGKIKSISFKKV